MVGEQAIAKEAFQLPRLTYLGSWRLEVGSCLVHRRPRKLIEDLAARAVGRDEALHALAGEDLARVDGALRVGRDHVEAEELAARLAHAPERTHHLPRLAVEEP